MTPFRKALRLAAKASKHYYNTVGPRTDKSIVDHGSFLHEGTMKTLKEVQRYGSTRRSRFAGQQYD